MKVKVLNKQVDKCRRSYQSSIDNLMIELEKISGLTLYYNDFPGDGLGVGVEELAYMGIEDLIKIIEKKGTFNEDDIIDVL